MWCGWEGGCDEMGGWIGCGRGGSFLVMSPELDSINLVPYSIP